MKERSADGFHYLTTGTLARTYGVSDQSIRNWVRAGWLRPAAQDSAGRMLFDSDVGSTIDEYRARVGRNRRE